MRRPNFLIVGAAKCGTTSLHEYLRGHPDIFMPKCKEIGFFSGKEDDAIRSIDDYYKFFVGARNEKRIGEASVAYLYSRIAPKRIKENLGAEVKIVIVLRHPVQMAYSLWGQNTRDGGETLSFEEAISKESERSSDDAFRKKLRGWSIENFSYVDRARFAPQVARYLETFGRRNVRVYIYERFFADIEGSLKDLYDFLEVDPSFRLSEYGRFNPAGGVKSKLLHRIYSERIWWTTPIRALLPARIRRGVMMTLYNLNTDAKPLPPLSATTKHALLAYFKDDIAALERMLGTSLAGVWK